MILDDLPLHIGLCSPALPDSGASNGIVTYTKIMRDALRTMGHHVTVVTTREIEHFDGRIAALPEPNPLLRRLWEALERRHDGDGSHAVVRRQIVSGFLAARRAGVQVFEIEESFGWARRLVGRGTPVVQRLHGPHAFVRQWMETTAQQPSGELKEAAEIASMRKVQAVTAPTQSLLSALSERFGLHLSLARAIPNPIPLAPSARRWRLVDADPDQLFYVGRFDLLKGADVTLRAFSRALEQRPSLRLIMAGPDLGIAEPDGALVHFDDFVTQYLPTQVRDRVRFIGAQTPDRIAQIRLQSVVAIVGSRFENFPYSLAEAMAVGMPVLTTDTFGGAEMIRSGKDGLIVPAGDVESMARAILEITNDAKRAANMGRSAYRRAGEWLSPERVARETVKLYREAMAGVHWRNLMI